MQTLPRRLPVDVAAFYLLGASISLKRDICEGCTIHVWRVGLSWPLQGAHGTRAKPVEENFWTFDNTVEKIDIFKREIKENGYIHVPYTLPELNNNETIFSRLKGSYLVAKFQQFVFMHVNSKEDSQSYDMFLDVHSDPVKVATVQKRNSATLVGFAAQTVLTYKRRSKTFDVPLRCRHSFTALLELMLSLVEGRSGDSWKKAWEGSRLRTFFSACGGMAFCDD